MANGPNTTMADETRINIGALQQRVFGLESGQQSIVQTLSSLQSRVEGLFSNLSAKIEERARPQWSLLVSIGGFALMFVVAVGSLAYWPVRENLARLETEQREDRKAFLAALQGVADRFASMGEKFVTIRELDARTVRGQADFARLTTDIRTVVNDLVPRAEHAERWRAVDQQFASYQRQIDDIKKFQADLVPAKEYLRNIDDRLRSVETRRPN